MRGLEEAMDEVGASEGLILALDRERELIHREKKVTVKPAW